MEAAIAYKNEYDVKLIGLTNQYGIETEAELIGGNILRLSRHFQKQFGKVKKRIHLAGNLLKREARAWFFGQQGDEEEQCFFLTKGPAFHVTANFYIIGFLTGWSYFSMSFDWLAAKVDCD